ncbi:MAG: 16S rRNA (cytidine(1402)-2'-O)-methyltransferase [bacterium]
MNSKTGTLYVVSTPIGNLGDMTFRAVEVLKQVDLVLAEDTRHASILFNHFDIRSPLWSFHEHNERKQLPEVLNRLEGGHNVALISDAGTPLISDPGYPLVSEARESGLDVVPIPGVSAVIAALSVSGLPTDRFCFEGFIPTKPGPRKEFIEARTENRCTTVFYESSHRILRSLAQICESMGRDRKIVVARELTKKFEQFYVGTAEQVLHRVSTKQENQKGEFVIIVSGLREVKSDDTQARAMLEVLMQEMPLKTASKLVTKLIGGNRNHIYQLGLEMQTGQS